MRLAQRTVMWGCGCACASSTPDPCWTSSPLHCFVPAGVTCPPCLHLAPAPQQRIQHGGEQARRAAVPRAGGDGDAAPAKGAPQAHARLVCRPGVAAGDGTCLGCCSLLSNRHGAAACVAAAAASALTAAASLRCATLQGCLSNLCRRLPAGGGPDRGSTGRGLPASHQGGVGQPQQERARGCWAGGAAAACLGFWLLCRPVGTGHRAGACTAPVLTVLLQLPPTAT